MQDFIDTRFNHVQRVNLHSHHQIFRLRAQLSMYEVTLPHVEQQRVSQARLAPGPASMEGAS